MRVLAIVGLTMYVAIALINYSVVQSVVGSVVSKHLSQQWGCTLRIGSLHATPFDHLMADNLLLVAPDGDTLLNARKLRVRFRKFPYSDNGLHLERVYLADAHYHFATANHKTNLQFLIDQFGHKKKKDKERTPFTVDVGTLTLNRVHYVQDLPDNRKRTYDHGVVIPHMEFADIKAKFRHVHVVNDDVTCRIVRMQTTEKSGFRLSGLKGDVHVGQHDITATDMHVITPRSDIHLDCRLAYDGWKGIKGYVNTVQHTVNLHEGTHVDIADAAFWAPVLWGIEAHCTISGSAYGTIDSLVTDGLTATWGDYGHLSVKGSVVGLPHIKQTSFDVDVEQLYSTLTDLLPTLRSLHQDAAIDIASKAEYVDLSATMKGNIFGHCTLHANLATELGHLDIDAMRRDNQLAIEAESAGLNTSEVCGQWLERTALSLNANAVLPDKAPTLDNIRAHLQAELRSTVVQHQHLEPTALEAKLDNGTLHLTASNSDTAANFALQADANIAAKQKKIDALLNLHSLNLYAFMPKAKQNIDKQGIKTIQASSINLSANGEDVDNMEANLVVDNLRINDINLHRAEIDMHADNKSHKSMRLSSDLADATLDGAFAWNDLATTVNRWIGKALPSDIMPQPTANVQPSSPHASLKMNLRWKDASRSLPQLVQGIEVATGTRVDATFNDNEGLKLAARSDKVTIGNLMLEELGMNSYQIDTAYRIRAEVQQINIGQRHLLDALRLTTTSNADMASARIVWGDNQASSSGNIVARLENMLISLVSESLRIGDDHWQLIADNGIDIGHGIMCNNISLNNANQEIRAKVQITGADNDGIDITSTNFDIAPIAQLLLQSQPISVGGIVDGRFSMYGISHQPYFNANLTIGQSHFNGQQLGTIKCRSNWNAELNTLNLQLHSQSLNATGWVGLSEKHPTLNFNADFDNFDIAVAAPFLSSIATKIEGRLHGNLDISGTLQSPIVIGKAHVQDGLLALGATGVTYLFNDSLHFKNNRVSLQDFGIHDQKGNTLRVNGYLNYAHLQEIGMSLSLHTDNITLLDLRDGEQFYGTIMAAADGKLEGTTDKLDLKVSARTNPGTSLTVAVTEKKHIKGLDYITFVSDKADPSTDNHREKKRQNINIEADLSITPQATLNIPMEFSMFSATVKTAGSGEMHLTMQGNSTPDVNGNYEISTGSLKLSIAQLLKKDFTIEQGSSINMQGNLLDTRFDIHAIYAQRVNLSSLTGELTSIDNMQKYIQVEDIISLTGDLQDPTIGFDLRLPNADKSVEEEVFAYIDRNNERDMLNQTLSLLLFGQFYNSGSTGAGTTNTASVATAGGIGILASFGGNLVGDLTQAVNLNVDYKAATELTNEQLDINVSKDWGRWYMESTLGYGGDSRTIETSTYNGAIVDALLGYRITPLLHIFAYNRTNTNDYNRAELPFKQGLGLKLTKDFDRWKDLIPRKKTTLTNDTTSTRP